MENENEVVSAEEDKIMPALFDGLIDGVSTFLKKSEVISEDIAKPLKQISDAVSEVAAEAKTRKSK